MLYVFMNNDTKYCISGDKLITNHSVCQEFFYFFISSAPPAQHTCFFFPQASHTHKVARLVPNMLTLDSRLK